MSSEQTRDRDIETSLRAVIRRLIDAHWSLPDVLREERAVDRGHGELWSRLVHEVGVGDLLSSKSPGGPGADPHLAAAVITELGTALAPVPFIAHSVIATACLAEPPVSEAGERARRCLGILAVPWTTHADELGDGPVTERRGRLTGVIRAVAHASQGDHLLVPVTWEGSLDLRLVAVEQSSVEVRRRNALDITRPICDVRLEGAETSTGPGELATGLTVSKAWDLGAIMLAVEQVAIARWCLDTSVAYVGEREQFGRPIGSFQGIKHRLADLWAAVASASAVAEHCAGLAYSIEVPFAASLAQAYCADVAVRAAEECIQLHGGLGMTWDSPAHLYLKRAKANQLALGSTERHRARLARLVDLGPPVPESSPGLELAGEGR